MEEGLGKNMSERCSTSITSSLQATQNDMIGNSSLTGGFLSGPSVSTSASWAWLTLFGSVCRGSEAPAASAAPRAGGQAGPAAALQPQLRPGL